MNLHAWQTHFSIDNQRKYNENFTHFSYVNFNAPKGGSIKYAMSGEFSQFNLFTSHLIQHAIIFDTLMRQSGDENNSYYPLIAKRLMIADDQLSVIFHIDERAKWSDNKVISVEDILFSYEFFIANQHFIDNIDDVEIVSGQKIKFSFCDADLHRQTIDQIAQIPIIPRIFYENMAIDFDVKNLPQFSGPYAIDNFCLGSFIKYKRNRDYWAKDLPVNKGRFNFDEIIFYYFNDPKIAAISINNKRTDVRIEYTSHNWHFLYPRAMQWNEFTFVKQNSPNLIKEEIDQLNVIRGARFFLYNNSRNLFQDINFRRVLSELFDFDDVNKKIFNEDYVRLNTFFPGLNRNQNMYDKLEFYKKSAEILTLLRKANLYLKNGKIVDDNGKQIEVSILLFHHNQKRFVEKWIKNIEKIGIKVNTEINGLAQYYSRLQKGNYDIAPYEFRFYNVYDSNVIQSFHSRGSRNFMKIKNAQLDEMLDDFYHEHDMQKKTKLIHAIDCFLFNNHFALPQWTSDKLRLVFWNKFSRPTTMTSQGSTDKIDYLKHGFDTWWITTGVAI